MNIYRIIEDGQDRLWQADSMGSALKLAEDAYIQEEIDLKEAGTEQDFRDFYRSDILNSCELIGELSNDVKDVDLKLRLQRALFFWLPSVPADDPEIFERVQKDAFLLTDYRCGDELSAESLGWIKFRTPWKRTFHDGNKSGD